MEINLRTRLAGGHPLPAQSLISTDTVEVAAVFACFHLIKNLLPKTSKLHAQEFNRTTAEELRLALRSGNIVIERNKLYPAKNNTVITIWASRFLTDINLSEHTISYTVEVEEG